MVCVTRRHWCNNNSLVVSDFVSRCPPTLPYNSKMTTAKTTDINGNYTVTSLLFTSKLTPARQGYFRTKLAWKGIPHF